MTLESIVAILVAVITTIIAPIVVHYVKELFKKKKKDPLTEAIQVNQMITEKLEKIKNEIDGDRIWLLQFHNGGHFYPTGKSIQKFSMVYELTGTGIPPCQNQFQNIPVSLFSKTMNKLRQGDIISIVDVVEDPTTGLTTAISDCGTKSTYIFPIMNIKDEFVAIVGVDYHGSCIELSKREIYNTELEIATIGGVLHNYLQS